MQTPAQCELNKINFFYYIFQFLSFRAGFKVLINNTVKSEVTAWVGVGWGCTVNSVKDLLTALTIYAKQLGLLCDPY